MYNFNLSLTALRCNISFGRPKIIRFLRFEFVLRVFFAEDFGIRIDEMLLQRNFFNMLLLFLRSLRNKLTINVKIVLKYFHFDSR